MADHTIEGIMGVTLDKLRTMIDSSTIIGEPIHVENGTTIIPVSKVTFGFASGGSDVGAKSTKEMFGGGSGAGVSITPIAFLVVNGESVRTVQLVERATGTDNAIAAIPGLVEKLTGLLGKKKDGEKTDAETKADKAETSEPAAGETPAKE